MSTINAVVPINTLLVLCVLAVFDQLTSDFIWCVSFNKVIAMWHYVTLCLQQTIHIIRVQIQ